MHIGCMAGPVVAVSDGGGPPTAYASDMNMPATGSPWRGFVHSPWRRARRPRRSAECAAAPGDTPPATRTARGDRRRGVGPAEQIAATASCAGPDPRDGRPRGRRSSTSRAWAGAGPRTHRPRAGPRRSPHDRGAAAGAVRAAPQRAVASGGARRARGRRPRSLRRGVVVGASRAGRRPDHRGGHIQPRDQVTGGSRCGGLPPADDRGRHRPPGADDHVRRCDRGRPAPGRGVPVPGALREGRRPGPGPAQPPSAH